MKFVKLLTSILLLFSSNLYADETDKAKQDFIRMFTNSIADALENIIVSDKGGDTEVQITTGKDYKSEFSVMTVRPLAVHPGVDAWFVQLQFNEQKVRGDGRLSTNLGLGYRKLSDDKSYMLGANVFVDYDEKENARTSVGLELRASAFEAIINYYEAISSANTVGSYTERTLSGMEVSLIGEVPYFPWANVIINSYEWQADKNSKNSKGEKYSVELSLTPSFILEGGINDNNLEGSDNYIKAYFVYPPRNRVAASTNFVSENAFSEGDMSLELLSKVRRTNKQAIESEGTGVVITRLN